MFRRAFVAGLAGSAAAQCAPRSHPSARRWVPVKVDADRVLRVVTGLRPFRPSGFVVRAEEIFGKTVVHDYGHGGAGVTLSWGTALLAVNLLDKKGLDRAAVLGAGAVGLATARLLQRRGIAVTIYAASLPPDTTSNVAGALWSPFLVADKERRTPEFDDRLHEAARASWRAFSELAGIRFGIRWLESYSLRDDPPPATHNPIGDLFPGSKLLGPGEHPFPSKYASRWLSMLIDPATYLEAMLADVRGAGGRIVVGAIEDRAALAALPERVIFNCTGLGAKALFGDDELIPIKGQLSVLAPQPEVDYLMLKDDLYMFPRRDGILLGGTHERGQWGLDPDTEAAKTILAGHRAVFEGMRR